MGVAALADISRAMMNLGNVPRNICHKLFGKAAKTATKLDSLVLLETDRVQKTCVKHYANIIPKWVKHIG